jgi:hypothetical protein
MDNFDIYDFDCELQNEEPQRKKIKNKKVVKEKKTKCIECDGVYSNIEDHFDQNHPGINFISQLVNIKLKVPKPIAKPQVKPRNRSFLSFATLKEKKNKNTLP